MSRHTIREWEKIKGVQILDPDGFDRKDPELMTRTFNEHEFNEGMMGSTVRMRSVTTPTSTDEVKPTPVGEFNYRPGVSVRSANQPQTELQTKTPDSSSEACKAILTQELWEYYISLPKVKPSKKGRFMSIQTGEVVEFILAHQEQAVREARIDEMKLHRKEWELFGDRPPYKGESVSLPILLAYHDDRIAELTSKESE